MYSIFHQWNLSILSRGKQQFRPWSSGWRIRNQFERFLLGLLPMRPALRFLTRPKHQKNPRFWTPLFCRIQQTVLKSGVCKSESAFHTVQLLWVCFFTPMSRRETNFSGIFVQVQMIFMQQRSKHVIFSENQNMTKPIDKHLAAPVPPGEFPLLAARLESH